jgi:sulfoacetaldehyde dehydrogenase
VAINSARDFNDAIRITREIQLHLGAGHSVGLHSTDHDRPIMLGRSIPTSRVIVNQAHCFATGGAFDNGMPFSLSMGCGSWGGNSIDDNLHWRHFLQTTKVVRQIPPCEPKLDEIFADYWAEAGQ